MKILRYILLLASLSMACSYMVMPTDFANVASGTRANLKANFSETENKFNPCADSVAEVRARLSGYSTSLTITSLEHMRLRLDSDASATARFFIEGSSGDSLFRVAEDFRSRFFGHLAIDSSLTVAGTATITGALTLTAAPVFSALTASRLMATDGSKVPASVSDLTSWIAGTANQITSTSDGDGSLTLSLPSAVTMPGTLGVTGLTTLSAGLGVTGTTTLGTLNTTGDISVSRSGAGINAVVQATNTNNSNGSSNAVLALTTGGSSSGDPYISYNIGGTVWAAGLDNSDGDAYVITPGLYPGVSTNALKITTAGAVSIPGTLDLTGAAAFTSAPVFSSVTASEFLLVNGSKALTSVAGIGSGSVMRAVSPTTTGTLTTDAITASGTVTADTLISSKFYTEATFTLTGTGFTSSPTGTARYVRVGKMVTLYIPSIQATSNASTLTYTGVPAAIRPARTQTVPVEVIVDNSSNFCAGYIDVGTGGTLTVARRTTATLADPSGFTTSNTKGISGATINYTLQ